MDNRHSKEAGEDRARLICLDTESSICLALDKSLYTKDAATQTTPHGSQDNQQAMHQLKAAVSSDSHFIPRVQEINGSSDSQQHQNRIGAFAHENLDPTTGHKSSKNSLATEGEQLGDSDTFLHRSLSDAGTDLDRELQAAVDMMLQGSTSISLPQRSYQINASPHGTFPFSENVSHQSCMDSDRAFVPGTPLAPEPASTRAQRFWQGGKQLRKKIAGRFAWRQGNVDEEDKKSLSSVENEHENDAENDIDSDNVKRKMGDDEAVEAKRLKCAECNPTTAVIAATSTATAIPMVSASLANSKFIGPVMRYVQRRPLTSLSIMLGVLLGLLAIIIAILVVAVFPFLMRTTLQDLSFVVTSVRAAPPPQVSRALLVGKSQHNPLRDLPVVTTLPPQVFGREQVEPIVHKNKQFWVRELSEPSIAHSSAPMSIAPKTPVHFISMSAHARSAAEHLSQQHSDVQSSQLHTDMQSTTSAVHSSASSHQDSASHHSFTKNNGGNVNTALHAIHSEEPENNRKVTIVNTHTSTMHVMHGFVPTPAALPIGVSATTKADDIPNMTYKLQIGGNMTSGGPIGVDIEFTEPLRLFWNDIEVGSITHPQSIHVPGRGTTQWSWPSFDVTMPAATSSAESNAPSDKRLFMPHTSAVQSLVQVGADKIAVSANEAAVAQRRVFNGNVAFGRSSADKAHAKRDQTDDLNSWFAIIKEHRPFTMLWRSSVKISAMGLHAKNLKFEKVVRVSCDGSGNCSIDGASF
ncbi:hypothetical protein GGI25_003897 [Coemansia spiralis]|uniref:Uncharacterized protein n=2 Tax=Coemansia TaxID=4863 RepID=A0A9W8KX46_9FUNG|nr:hypothetical protein BX070DRAFT_238055 [Coemansia spiralis]KAJ1991056.1 hypothetical protein EDC05_003657 [Coemansia umbellata]KAJ2621131.1 hypothetical protein GGI26_004394 [Coemansia sp. RSA 1358]KAJ2675699.1 hypothetical protein GGI25_003897 [Coemansia spiralis]